MTILLSELKSLLKHIELSQQLIDTETYICIDTNSDVLVGLSDEYNIYEDVEGNCVLAFTTLKQEIELNE